MKYISEWLCSIKDENDFFKAEVPGNAQWDYAKAHNWGDVHYGDNCKKYDAIEDKSWVYKTEFGNIKESGKRLYFVSLGIDYECDIYVNSKHICHHIGMFEKIEADITDYVEEQNTLEIVIAPPPKDINCPTVDRSQAAQSTKAAVSYGWDWHPRLIPTGIWQDTYFETRGDEFVNNAEPFYTLNDQLTAADLRFEVDCKGKVEISLYAPDGNLLYIGDKLQHHLENIELWWCNGQGNPSLYKYVVKSAENTIEGFIGFKSVQLVMNEGAWDEPNDFPKSRSVAPITIMLNGRKIFAKGSNFLPPEIFYGTLNEKRYDELLKLAKDANMNIVRTWGGAVVPKKCFFDLCDKYGIMVWQEFPLACNNYYATEEYLRVLEQEATYIIKTLRSRACLVMWCGGNELFNRWSGMTDQSLALRLLNMLCYQLDREKPFIMTAPLMGMGHGFYMFYDRSTQQTIMEIHAKAHYTAYSEFGLPSITDYETLKEIVPPEEFENIKPGTTWETHHGFNSWDAGSEDTWLCFEDIKRFYGEQNSLEDYIERSLVLQGEGLKFVFEEARRQKPYCSMAMNWCYNEVWKVVAGQSLVAYPAKPKKSYYCVKDALRPILPSLRAVKFAYVGGDEFKGELWLLNDSPAKAEATVDVYFEINGKQTHIMTWNTGKSEVNSNVKGHTVCFKLPEDASGEFKILLKSDVGDSVYRFIVNAEQKTEYSKSLNA